LLLLSKGGEEGLFLLHTTHLIMYYYYVIRNSCYPPNTNATTPNCCSYKRPRARGLWTAQQKGGQLPFNRHPGGDEHTERSQNVHEDDAIRQKDRHTVATRPTM